MRNLLFLIGITFSCFAAAAVVAWCSFWLWEGSSVMIGTTEWVECKEKAMGIIADWLWVLAIIVGEITGVI